MSRIKEVNMEGEKNGRNKGIKKKKKRRMGTKLRNGMKRK